jgi:hypothetical protein
MLLTGMWTVEERNTSAQCTKEISGFACSISTLHSPPPTLARNTTQPQLPRPRNMRSEQEEKDVGLTQLDNVANNTHDQETHAHGLRDAQELALVGC